MIFDKVQSMMAEQMGISKDDITLDSDIIKDIGADSLDIVEMLMNVETEWGIVIDDSEAATLKSVRDVVEFIQAHM